MENTFSLWMCLALICISVPNFGGGLFYFYVYMCIRVSMSMCVVCCVFARMHTHLCVSASRGQKRESEALSWKSLGATLCGCGSGCQAVNSFCPLKRQKVL